MRRSAVAVALLASAGCGETRGDLSRSGTEDPTHGDSGSQSPASDSGWLVPPPREAGTSKDVAAPSCVRVRLPREESDGAPSCAFQVPTPAVLGVPSYFPAELRLSYEDTAGPRYVLPLTVVRNEADCGPAEAAYYWVPRGAPEHAVLCPATCALRFAAEGGTTGGAIVATYGCPTGDPIGP